MFPNYNNIMDIYFENNNIVDLINNDTSFLNFFTILDKIYEKSKKVLYIVQSKINNQKYTIKAKLKDDNEEEIIILNKINDSRNNNIVNCIQIIDKEIFYYFINDYYEGINLNEYTNNNTLNEKECIKIFKQIVEGIKYLHDKNIIHCDLKLENIIINGQKEIKIIDLELAKICTEEEGFTSDIIFGTIEYLSPESYNLGIYSKKSDIWSLGVILLFLLLIKKNTLEIDKKNICHLNSGCNLDRYNEFKNYCLQFETEMYGIHEKIISLLKKMLVFEDYNRINIDTIQEELKKID